METGILVPTNWRRFKTCRDREIPLVLDFGSLASLSPKYLFATIYQ
jgi:hypothetical protein